MPKHKKNEISYYKFLKSNHQNSDLEYQTYKAQIKELLVKNHFIEKDDAKMLVAFDYEINNGGEKIRTLPLYGQTGVPSSSTFANVNNQMYSGHNMYWPSYGIIGQQIYTRTVYKRYFQIAIRDIKKKKAVYQIQAISSGSGNTVSSVANKMLDAIFKNFPGKNGTTKKIVINKYN